MPEPSATPEIPSLIGPLPERLKLLYPFPSRFHRLSGDQFMHYLDEGEPSSHAVIMVHGNPSWSFLYRDLVFALRDTHRCIVPDHLGCGFSARPPRRVSLGEHMENLASWIQSLGLDSFDLVVHDWGGPIGLGTVLSQFPAQLRKVIILNTAAFASLRIPFRIALCKTPLLGPALIRGFNLFALSATRMAVTRPMSEAVSEGFLWPYRNSGTRRATADFVREIPLGPWHSSYRALRSIEETLPILKEKDTLIAWGMKDFCFNPAFLREWQRRLPGATVLEFPQAGHYLLEDTTSEQKSALIDFL